MRLIQLVFWVSICFLVAPSKVAAIAYSLLLGGTLIILIVSFGIAGVIVKGVRRLFGL